MTTEATLADPSIDTGPLPAPNAWAEALARIVNVIVREATGAAVRSDGYAFTGMGIHADHIVMDNDEQFVATYLHAGLLTMQYLSDTRPTTNKTNN